MKILVFSPSDGSVWHIPAEVVAKHRATHLSRKYTDKTRDDVFKAEFKDTMSIDGLLLGWVRNEMYHWSDVSEHAVMVESPKAGYEDEWQDLCAEGYGIEIEEVPQ